MNNGCPVRKKLRSVMITVLFSLLAAGQAQALSCHDCHGTNNPPDIRPLDDLETRSPTSGSFKGNHRNHLYQTIAPADCEPCHPGSSAYTSSHRNGFITVGPRINNSPLTTAYDGVTSARSVPQSPLPQLAVCSNINCHFERISTDAWGAHPYRNDDAATCKNCHDAPPADGAHQGKHRNYFGNGPESCRRCHQDHWKNSEPHSHALETGTRPLLVKFSSLPNRGGNYSGDLDYPKFLPSRRPARNGTCTDLYCHSDGRGHNGNQILSWSGRTSSTCFSCHKGRTGDNTFENCSATGGLWANTNPATPANGTMVCSPYLNMTSNGHGRLVGPQWIRRYSCSYCHNTTVNRDDEIMDTARHVNGFADVAVSPIWSIVGRPAPVFDPLTKSCSNLYCHSDGTSDPEKVRVFTWGAQRTECNTCHGHPRGSCANTDCHDGRTDQIGIVWTVKTGWPTGEEWKAAVPMFTNQGPGSARANSHQRHIQTNFSCDDCHAATIINGTCTDCHSTGVPPGSMGETSHINAAYHVNRTKDVVFKQGGSYNPVTRTCSNTACHSSGADPQWGGSVNSAVVCLSCHGTTTTDQDSFQTFNGTQARINLDEWATSGHGRPASAGPYLISGNPAANIPGNPCWYCHDSKVLHAEAGNPFRLRKHPQFANRFEKECVYCHMEGTDAECRDCHDTGASLAPQLNNPATLAKHGGSQITSGCRATGCHDIDDRLHRSGAGFWTAEKKADIKNQYQMMGVCLKCHDDDSDGKCNGCHTQPEGNPFKYALGFDPGTGRVKPQKARATSVHFGYKHFKANQNGEGWKGGKFCWDCHDPHGDSNIYMVQSQVATVTDGTFGIPQKRAAVSFTRKESGLDYARIDEPFNGICNVCHSAGSQHYRSDGGDGHNASRGCITCHEHRFSDSHGTGQACSTCHQAKPVPRHSGFGLPRDCTKCHQGTIGKRMDIMGQFVGTSHHVQGIEVTNRHCYSCHWESTPEGLIDIRYHEGYNYRNYSSQQNAKVDLVLWKPGVRPTLFKLHTTAEQFMASSIGTTHERAAVALVTNHCISCHSDQNNDSDPFGDCNTPRRYAWDDQSIASRYLQYSTTRWGKYNSAVANVAPKDQLTKAFSAHGNAKENQGGWSSTSGLDSNIPVTRGGSNANSVTCFDCHSSHGSKLVGVTSSYITFNGTRNGGNLKETQAGKGGYSMTYKATSYTAPGAPSPYNAGAGQCFDCHLTREAGSAPWGYQSTFGASEPVKGYYDTHRFDMGTSGATTRYPYKESPVKGGHLLATSPLKTAAQGSINGLCTPCHDPHGISRSLGVDRAYAVPLLKGTWMTSPYKEDAAAVGKTPGYFTDQRTFGSTRISEDASRFGGLCLRCHPKSSLTDGISKNQQWKSLDRVHEAVKGWGDNSQHSFPCAKCHTAHVASMPRLMETNCLDFTHQGRVVSGGYPGSGGPQGPGFPSCHPTGLPWPDNYWNKVTPW